ncbi:MAG: DUF4375 domain-containing protein [Bacteroidota bacterium]
MKRSHLLAGLLLLSGIITAVVCLEVSNDSNKFRNKKLDFIDKASDEQLLEVVHHNLAGKLPKDFNKSETAIYLVWQFEMESITRGYSGVYNSFTITYQDLPRAFRLIGANRHAELTEKANNIYEREHRKEYKGKEPKEFTYDFYPALDELEEPLRKLGEVEDLWDLQTDYIRKHKSDFVDK